LGVAEDDPELPTVDLAFPTPTTTRLIRTTNTQPPTAAAVEIDVDCEFDSDGKVYLWGALLSTPTTEPTFYTFGSPAPDFDEYALATEFLVWISEQLTTGDDTAASWFHYGSTEPRQLHRILGSAAHDVLARGIDILTDTIRPNFYGPVGYSLKQLAPAAGAHWRTDGATGADTYAWLDTARAGDAISWNMLAEYNEDDVRALRALRVAVKDLDLPGAVLDLESSAEVQG
ncbi:ribonuclease H-like domain-containing protein, partial [Mycolicibacterium hodleri]